MQLRRFATAAASTVSKYKAPAPTFQDKIPVPSNVHVLREGSILTISGPLGTNRTDLANLDTRGESAIRLGGPEDRSIDICSVSKAFHGTITSLIENKLEGVTRGFLVYLRIQGIGYRASLEGQAITLKLGYSHDIRFTVPDSMRAFLPDPTLIGLYGIDKNEVTQVAANIIKLRPPSVYKGKGIRLADSTPRLKVGKRK